VSSAAGSLTSRSTELRKGMDYEEWRELGRGIGLKVGKSLWEIADWVLFGEETYGKRYEDALETTGLDIQTLRNMKSVAERIYRRRYELSFAHHAEVASFRDTEVQELLLDQAVENGWSRNQLREAANEYRGESKPEQPKPDPRPVVQVIFKLKLTPDLDELVRAEAEAEDMQPEDWISAAIREKAERRLEAAA
jgi:hypothetical protein